MLTNQDRRAILEQVKTSGSGDIISALRGQVIPEPPQQQIPTPQAVDLPPASPPPVQNVSMDTIPSTISSLVDSSSNTSPQIQDLPTGSAEPQILKTGGYVQKYQPGGFNFSKKFDYSPEAIKERQKNKKIDWENLELGASFTPYLGEVIDAKNTIKSLKEGKRGEAALHAAGFMIPFVPGGALVRGAKKLFSKTNPNVVTDVFGNIIKKKGAIRLNRIEDANVSNKIFNRQRPDGSIPYEQGNWYSSQVEPFYLNKTKVAGTSDQLLPMDANRRVITGYLNPKDAEKFNILHSTKEAIDMSGGKGNLPIASEYLLPPELSKVLRKEGKILKPKGVLKKLTDFYKKKGGFKYENGGEKKVKEENTSLRDHMMEYMNFSGRDTNNVNFVMDVIAQHESGNVDDKIQVSQNDDGTFYDGPGRGAYQFEIGDKKGANTAMNRTANFLASSANKTYFGSTKTIKDFTNIYEKYIASPSQDFSKLSRDDQDALFLGDKLYGGVERRNNFDKVLKNPTQENVFMYWLTDHKGKVNGKNIKDLTKEEIDIERKKWKSRTKNMFK